MQSSFKFIWTVLIGFLLTGVAFAETPVSGFLATDAHWTVANSPYRLDGDLLLQEGAVLTIDPGVTVLMAPGAGLTVKNGSIKAMGNAGLPIQVLSSKGVGAAPGDWKQWVFTPGTRDTQLEHVIFQHGSGLLVQGAAPIFNFLEIKSHQGAAISMDLAASPSGVGNRASGNTIDRVVVPAGDIAGDIKWGLRGIPYLVLPGVLSVGKSPVITSIVPDVLETGESATVKLTGSRLSGLAEAVFEAIGLSANILPGATDTQANLSVQVAPSAASGAVPLRLLVAAGEVRLDQALNIVTAQPTMLSLNPARIYAGQGAIEIMAAGRNFTSQSSIWINGQASPTEFISTTQLRARVTAPMTSGDVQVSLRAPDPTKPGEYLTFDTLTLPVVSGQLLIQPKSLILTQGSSKDFSLTLPYQAPVGGVNLALVPSKVGVVNVPQSLNIPEGLASVSFQVEGIEPGNAIITVSGNGLVSAQASVTVTAPPLLSLSGGGFVASGFTKTAQLNLSESAPEGGVTVNLVSDDVGVASVPASVQIAAGQRNASFTMTGVASGNTTIRASANGYQPAQLLVSVDDVSLRVGQGFNSDVKSISVPTEVSQFYTLILSRPAPEGGLAINVSSGDPATASVTPAVITISEGRTSSDVQLQLTGRAPGSTILSASTSGLQDVSIPVTVVGKVRLEFSEPDVVVGKGLLTDSRELSVRLVDSQGAPYVTSQDVVVSLSSSNPAKLEVPDSCTIRSGKSTVEFYVRGIDLTEEVPVTIAATAAGYGIPVNKLSAQVVMPELVLYGLETQRTLGGFRNEISVAFKVTGASSANQRVATDKVVDLEIVEANPVGIVEGFYYGQTGNESLSQLSLSANNPFSPRAYIGVPTTTGSYKVRATVPGMGTVTSGTVTVGVPQELRFSRPTVVVGQGLYTYSNEYGPRYSEIYVQRFDNGNAYVEGNLVVNLTSTDPTKVQVPATVTIPEGSSLAAFPVMGMGLTEGGAVIVTATAEGLAGAQFSVDVVKPVFTLYGPNSCAIEDCPSYYRGIQIYMEIPGVESYNNQFAITDIPIDLAIVDAEPVGIVEGFQDQEGNPITQVMLPKDGAYVQFVSVGMPKTTGQYRVQITPAVGDKVISALAMVDKTSISFWPDNVTLGEGLVADLGMYIARGGSEQERPIVTVGLSCVSPTICQVDPEVNFGSWDNYVQVSLRAIKQGETTVTALVPEGYRLEKDLSVKVVPPELDIGVYDDVKVGGTGYGRVSLKVLGLAEMAVYQTVSTPITVTLKSSNPSIATVTGTMIIPEGLDSAEEMIEITGIAPGEVTITAESPGFVSSSITITVTP